MFRPCRRSDTDAEFFPPFFLTGKRGIFHADLSRPELTDLYNSRVMSAEKMTRRMGSSSSGSGIFSHSGVRVTLEDGSQWLIHKGDGYGDTSETVVTRASGMSSDWKVTQTKDIHGSERVADYVQAGGSDYNLITDNCHHASGRMMKLGG
uniref:Uncharacterized protein n=1 Tax=Oryzias latipes TaxID=8090 RepID=A0A3P9KJ72_ORYLA